MRGRMAVVSRVVILVLIFSNGISPLDTLAPQSFRAVPGKKVGMTALCGGRNGACAPVAVTHGNAGMKRDAGRIRV